MAGWWRPTAFWPLPGAGATRGAGKRESTAAKVLRALVDPNTPLTDYSERAHLAVAANNSWCYPLTI